MNHTNCDCCGEEALARVPSLALRGQTFDACRQCIANYAEPVEYAGRQAINLKGGAFGPRRLNVEDRVYFTGFTVWNGERYVPGPEWFDSYLTLEPGYNSKSLIERLIDAWQFLTKWSPDS